MYRLSNSIFDTTDAVSRYSRHSDDDGLAAADADEIARAYRSDNCIDRASKNAICGQNSEFAANGL
jgi:hypothetical protein